MLIDYLRYLAFGDRLRPFFEEGLSEYVDPETTTGQHLRFAPRFLAERFGWDGRRFSPDPFWRAPHEDLFLYWLRGEMGLAGGPDGLKVPEFEIGGPPATFVYKDGIRPSGLEILIDIDPARWTERYTERPNYEGIPIIYRSAGPARANLRSGDKLLDSRGRGHGRGTLCGVFSTTDGPAFALTCGHVAKGESHLFVERRQRIWKLPLWSSTSKLGGVLHTALPGSAPSTHGPVRAHLDAALIEVEPGRASAAQPAGMHEARIKPISAVLQEDPVRFRRAGRVNDTLARVTAVTVRKSMDLFRDGNLYDVGDVLMLGHRQPMYVEQRLSRPGDSGAAVRQCFSCVEPSTEPSWWYGMVLGGDGCNAYASYSEHLWAWATQEIGHPDLEFMFET